MKIIFGGGISWPYSCDECDLIKDHRPNTKKLYRPVVRLEFRNIRCDPIHLCQTCLDTLRLP